MLFFHGMNHVTFPLCSYECYELLFIFNSAARSVIIMIFRSHWARLKFTGNRLLGVRVWCTLIAGTGCMGGERRHREFSTIVCPI